MIEFLLPILISQIAGVSSSPYYDYMPPEIDAKYVRKDGITNDYILISARNVSDATVHIAVNPRYYVRFYNTNGEETGKRIRTYATRIRKEGEVLNTICKLHRITPLSIGNREETEILKIPLEKGDVQENTRTIEISFTIYFLNNANCDNQIEKELKKTIIVEKS